MQSYFPQIRVGTAHWLCCCDSMAIDALNFIFSRGCQDSWYFMTLFTWQCLDKGANCSISILIQIFYLDTTVKIH